MTLANQFILALFVMLGVIVGALWRIIRLLGEIRNALRAKNQAERMEKP